MVCRCACALDIILRLIFVTFSAFSHFFILICLQQKVAGYYVIPFECLSIHPSVRPSLLKCIDSGYLVCAFPPTVLLTK